MVHWEPGSSRIDSYLLDRNKPSRCTQEESQTGHGKFLLKEIAQRILWPFEYWSIKLPNPEALYKDMPLDSHTIIETVCRATRDIKSLHLLQCNRPAVVLQDLYFECLGRFLKAAMSLGVGRPGKDGQQRLLRTFY